MTGILYNDSDPNKRIEKIDCKTLKCGEVEFEHAQIQQILDIQIGDKLIFSPDDYGEDFCCKVTNILQKRIICKID